MTMEDVQGCQECGEADKAIFVQIVFCFAVCESCFMVNDPTHYRLTAVSSQTDFESSIILKQFYAICTACTVNMLKFSKAVKDTCLEYRNAY